MGKASRRKKKRGELPLDLEPSPQKASTRLAELIAPHMVDGETRDSYEALVVLGALAWNLSVQPEDEREGLTREAVRRARARGMPLTEEWLNELVARKLRLFPTDDRVIDNCQVRLEPDGRFTILVASLSAAI